MSTTLGLWTTKSNFPQSLSNTVACVCNGKLYVIGGFEFAQETGKMWEYNFSTDVWTQRASMPTARYDLAVVAYQDRYIFAIGGHTYTSPVKYGYIERYDTQTNTWLNYQNFTQIEPREDHEVEIINNLIYITGGAESATSVSKRVETFDPANPMTAVVRKADMLTGRNAHDCCVIDNKLYVFGGEASGGQTVKTEVYDPVSNVWSYCDDMPTKRRHLGVAMHNNRAYVVGGFNNLIPNTTSLRIVDEFYPFAPSGSQWRSVAQMNTSTGRDRFAIANLNGVIYATSGWYGESSSTGWFNTSVEAFTPPTSYPTYFTPLSTVTLPSSNNFSKDNIDYVRTKVNEFRVANGLSNYTWTDATIIKGVTPIKATHWNEIQLAIDEVYTARAQAYTTSSVSTRLKETILAKDSKHKLGELNNRITDIVKGLKNQ